MAGNIVRYGIIGCGIGFAHALGMQNVPGAKLVALCDTNAQKLELVRAAVQLDRQDCYVDYKPLLARDDIDAVIVASPDQFHCEQTVAALESGRHVLCEKPMALDLQECRDMIRASERTGKKLMIGQVCRYAPGFKLARDMIARGEIGELFFVESEYAHDYTYAPGFGNWRKDPVRLRQPVIGGGCHAVDLLRWIAGDPVQVNAYSNHKVLTDWPVDDCSISILKFPGNVLGKVFVSIGCKRDYTMRSVFYGTQGTIIADNTSSHITVYKNTIVQGGLFPGAHDQALAIVHPVNIQSHNTTAEIAELTDCILRDKPVLTDGREGAYTVAVCTAIVASAQRDGETVTVNYDF